MTILITGGSSGIGRAIAEEAAKHGHNLVLVARTKSRLAQTRRTILRRHKIQVQVYSADVGIPRQVEKVKAFCLREQCVPDVLVLNAGIWTPGPSARAKPQTIAHLMNVNVFSMFHFIREFTPLLKKSQKPCIILIGSTAGLEPHKSENEGSLYSTSKWAVRGLAANARRELARHDIGVTHIAPGSVMTEMWGRDGRPSRMLKASDVAKLVITSLHLSSQAVVEEIVIRPMHGNI